MEHQAEVDELRGVLASLHSKYESSMDRVAQLRAELRAQEAQLSQAVDAQATAEAQVAERDQTVDQLQRDVQAATKATRDAEKALFEAQSELDHERELTLAAEKATAKHKQVSAAHADRLRRELAAARRESEKIASRPAVASIPSTPSESTASTSSPASASTVLPDETAELRAELESVMGSHARIEASLQSSDVQIKALRDENLELKEQNERLQRLLEHRSGSSELMSTQPSSMPNPEAETSDQGQDTSGPQNLTLSLAQETQWGMDDRLSTLEQEKEELKQVVAKLKETNSDLTLCMAKMADQINQQEGYTVLSDAPTQGRTQNQAVNQAYAKGIGNPAPRLSPRPTHAQRAVAGQASRTSSIDWRSFVPGLSSASTPTSPAPSASPIKPTKSVPSPSTPNRRIAKTEEVEDEQDRIERERVRADMARWHLTTDGKEAAPAHPPRTHSPTPQGQGMGSFFARYLSTGTSEAVGSSGHPSSDAPGVQPDRFTAPPSRLTYRAYRPVASRKQHARTTSPVFEPEDTFGPPGS